jgi:transcriptional regulator with XRE-family HTH domain
MPDKEIKKKFGEHLRKPRRERGLAQEELTDRAGMHFTYIGQIERGGNEPISHKSLKLTRALRVNAGQLLPF